MPISRKRNKMKKKRGATEPRTTPELRAMRSTLDDLNKIEADLLRKEAAAMYAEEETEES